MPMTQITHALSCILKDSLKKRTKLTTENYPLASPKPFSKDLHEENDAIAKAFATRLVERFFFDFIYLEENPDQYGIDLIARDHISRKIMAYLEVEVKSAWEGQYPFPDIRVPYRKEKFFLNAIIPTYILIFSGDMQRMALIKGSDVGQAKIVQIDNRFVKGERFFSVDPKRALFLRVQ